MTTDISVSSTSYQVENRSWLLDHDHLIKLNVTLDIAAFTEGTHYPNGFIPSGTVLGKITTGGLYGPYDNVAEDGTEVAAGILYSSVNVKSGAIKVGGAALVHGVVKESKLVGIDSAGKTDLKHVIFE